MILIPAVDIKGGRCVRLREGRADAETVFSDFPKEMAQQWVEQGAERLHVIDLDGAFEKGPRNFSSIKDIITMIKIPIQLGGGIRDLETVENYLSLGVAQVILGTVVIKEPGLVKEACRLFPDHIMVSLDARDNRIAVEGWTELLEIDPVDLVKQYQDWGVKAIIFTDIARDGTQTGPSISSTRRLAQETSLPVIAAGGIATLEDIQSLAPLETEGLVGIITGRAIYSGSLNLSEAIDWLKKNTARSNFFIDN
ncbi:MAG: 1-(5-phosphoribosyl)-5-((5-phosphoribosylamino)methylideneamino)imidazole-4-carboxamide isomerase [Desulfobacca sp.]|nr:1-(5-phosphoribosyl)-5-((5-phosphoribosylamino)methylideneamino)imidazole-4-carboxamide isomerase [Desulfobacca sp.]